MSIYKRTHDPEIDKITQLEVPLYGSSRLGLHEINKEIARYILPNNTVVLAPMSENKHILGLKKFEMANHLGNLLSVISDRKLSINTAGVNHSVADVVSFSDYYPFGMLMPGRNGGENFQYSFNGKEGLNEVKGHGNHLDFGARCYDNRLGRRSIQLIKVDFTILKLIWKILSKVYLLSILIIAQEFQYGE